MALVISFVARVVHRVHPSHKVPALDYLDPCGHQRISVAICHATDSHYHKGLDDVNYKSLGIIF